MKKLILLMAFVICVLGVGAQNTKVVTGVVIDEKGNPVSNALVEAWGSPQSTTTADDGSFSMELPIWVKSLTTKSDNFWKKKIDILNPNQVLFEVESTKGAWFVNGVFSHDDGDAEYNRAGLMGGYLGKWGGYLKVTIPFGEEINAVTWPSVSAGVIKRLSKCVHLYLGVGYASVYFHTEAYDWEGRKEHYYDACYGFMGEAGAIFKFKKFNFGVGYGLSASSGYLNHNFSVSLGYCF